MPDDQAVLALSTIDLAKQLIARPSVTPDDAGCQDLLAKLFSAAGFQNLELHFGDTKNLWSKRGDSAPLLVFAGHTDVVPTGALSDWRYPPFEAKVKDGYLHGRGAADMKGGAAAIAVAVTRFVRKHPNHKGSIALLFTSDEEGPGVNGTVKALEKLTADGVKIDYCIVGEPTSVETMGDMIKIGRRGSLSGLITVRGMQGHVAYPDIAVNPIHRFAPALTELCATKFDSGNEHFQPTALQFSNVNAGVGVGNVIPAVLKAHFNIRYSPEVTADQLKEKVEGILRKHELEFDLEWSLSGLPFLTKKADLVGAVQVALKEVLGKEATVSTSGGTSDARFFAPLGAQVVELGVINDTIHKVNECVSVAELDKLTDVFEKTLEHLLL